MVRAWALTSASCLGEFELLEEAWEVSGPSLMGGRGGSRMVVRGCVAP